MKKIKNLDLLALSAERAGIIAQAIGSDAAYPGVIATIRTVTPEEIRITVKIIEALTPEPPSRLLLASKLNSLIKPHVGEKKVKIQFNNK